MCEFHNNRICKSIAIEYCSYFFYLQDLGKGTCVFQILHTLVVYSLDIHEAAKTGNKTN